MGVGNVTVVFLGTGSLVHGQHSIQEDACCRDRKMYVAETGRRMLQRQEDVAETGRCML